MFISLLFIQFTCFGNVNICFPVPIKPLELRERERERERRGIERDIEEREGEMGRDREGGTEREGGRERKVKVVFDCATL